MVGHLFGGSGGPAGPTTVRYPSGRPWVVARSPWRHVSHLSRGADALVLIGPARVPDRVLADLLDRARTGADLDRLLRRLPGIHHVVSLLQGEVRVRGTASGLRRVYHCRYGGLRVASDRATVLAALCDAEVDEGALALRLLDFVPHPLRHRTLWHGVEEVEPEFSLTLGDDGPGYRIHRWWNSPRPHLSMARGKSAVAAALENSVREYTKEYADGRNRISGDLSGGLDSTSVAFLARRAGVRDMLAVTVAGRDAFAEDEQWARRAVEEFPGLDHHVIPAHEYPLFFAGVGTPGEPLDEPFYLAPARERARAMLEPAVRAGSRIHLTGHGGDELFNGVPAAYRDLFARRPLMAWSRLNATRHLHGWPLWPTLRQLLARPRYGSWLARSVTPEPLLGLRTPLLTWGAEQSVHPWITARGRRLIRAGYLSAARRARPLAPGPGRHTELDVIRTGARAFQALEDLGVAMGVPVAAPFFDDRVIEAVLSVRVEDRMDPARYKPLLVESLRGTVPDALLDRTTKDEMSQDQALGLRRHAPDLRRLWTDARLARRGLVDADLLVRLADEPDTPLLQENSLWTVVACESWLRAIEDQGRSRANRTNTRAKEGTEGT
ncbi:asparagine synthase-related protein [Streptomyces mobaraensis]|uniref:asparagine synthase (glutamine-hydrolyzing) n=1 Tax=Streptomyces mobaraensis (strain ATCC 29032 / DSM 40847 / JCM 4168 / NBRC 13819 / NCIMB 11159 / IPCR 16-22) TaxID=1223523 RepID=M3C9B1_STRM1|nr:asparagine synthase-related protein [Streptomyces mobaraensis]EMF00612.1 asparagine synthetase [Streptomyces mobaraensis NBRC 13819 = DSM 40847]